MWVPASNTHAIENVAVSYIFSDPLPLKFVKGASAYAEKMLSEGKFSGKNEIHSASVVVAQGTSVIPQSKVVGYSYLAGNNEEVLRLQSDLAQFNATEYGTWKGFVEEADRLLTPFVADALTVTGVKNLKLEYSDRFVFQGSLDEADIFEVLNSEAGVGIPDNEMQDGMPWHDRRGWFRPCADGSLLINRNIAVGEVAHRDNVDVPLRSVQIVIVVETRFDTVIEDAGKLQSLLAELHDVSKEIFASVITLEAAEKVSL